MFLFVQAKRKEERIKLKTLPFIDIKSRMLRILSFSSRKKEVKAAIKKDNIECKRF